MVRLVFHDAGSYSAAAGDGGVNASIRFELDRPDNFGLKRGWCAMFCSCKSPTPTAHATSCWLSHRLRVMLARQSIAVVVSHGSASAGT